MNKTAVTVSLGKTWNLGDYNSTKAEFGLTTEIPTDREDKIKEEFRRLLRLVADEIKEHGARVTRIKNARD